MEKRWIRLISSAALCLVSLTVHGQQPAASGAASSTASQVRIDPGTLVQVEVSSDIDVKKVHAGDTFRTKLWEEVRSGDKVVLPQKTILVGHVVEAQPRTKDNAESKLTIAFDKAMLKDGSERPLRGVVERVELSPIAVAAAAAANTHSYNPGLNPGSTTNVAMPASGEDAQDRNRLPTPGPTNVRDASIVVKGDPSGTFTVLTSATKADVKLKHEVTLDVRITHTGD